MTKELLAEVDVDDKVIAVHPKEKLKEFKFRHRISIVLPLAADGKVFLSRRAKDKFPFPDVYVCAAGGKVRADESYEAAAIRETKEELGISAQVRYIATSRLDLPEEKAIVSIFVTEREFSPEEFLLDASEVQFVEAFYVNDVVALINSQPHMVAPTFAHHFKVFASAYKELKD